MDHFFRDHKLSAIRTVVLPVEAVLYTVGIQDLAVAGKGGNLLLTGASLWLIVQKVTETNRTLLNILCV